MDANMQTRKKEKGQETKALSVRQRQLAASALQNKRQECFEFPPGTLAEWDLVGNIFLPITHTIGLRVFPCI